MDDFAAQLKEWNDQEQQPLVRSILAEFSSEEISPEAAEQGERARRELSCPQFQESFRARTEKTWQAFSEKNEEILRLLSENEAHENDEEILETLCGILYILFPEFPFAVKQDKDEDPYELVLQVMANAALFRAMMYFRSREPEELKKDWKITVGSYADRKAEEEMGDMVITGEDVLAVVSENEDDTVSLELYCEKLLTKDPDEAWNTLFVLTDEVLGDVPTLALIDRLSVLSEEPKEDAVPLCLLPEKLEERGYQVMVTAEQYLDDFRATILNSDPGPDGSDPAQRPNAEIRQDVYYIMSNFWYLQKEYRSGLVGSMDILHDCGAVAGFLFFSLEPFADSNEAGDEIERLEKLLEKEAGEETFTDIGNAEGRYWGYLDLIAWDLDAVLEAAARIFQERPSRYCGFQVFRPDTQPVMLRGTIR